MRRWTTCWCLALLALSTSTALAQSKAKASGAKADAVPSETKPTPSTAAPEAAAPGDDAAAPAEGAANDGVETAAAAAENADKKADETKAPAKDLPTVRPKKSSYKAADGFDGKLGLGLLFMNAEPFGGRTGYTQAFGVVDWDIFGTGWGVHVDFDVRSACPYNAMMGLFEPRNANIVDVDPARNRDLTTPYDIALPCRSSYATSYANADDTQNYTDYYAQTGTYVTGRTYDYLRLDELNVSYDSESFGFAFGRLFVPTANQAQVDGLELHFSFGSLGRAGAFAGLKPNPFHQQVVGASSGTFTVDAFTSDYTQAAWGTTVADPVLRYNGGTSGPFSNEWWPGGYPWVQVASTRFITFGGYTSLRMGSFFTDIALTTDVFDAFLPLIDTVDSPPPPGGNALDRVSLYTHGGWRILPSLMASWRATIDVVGVQPLSPRNVFLNLAWRNLGPVSMRATYFKINTYATALSYFQFFRPLEQPGDVTNLSALMGGDMSAFDLDRVNNTRLFVVDRDRLRLEVATRLGMSTQLYGEVFLERRDDQALDDRGMAAAFERFGTSLEGIGTTLGDLTALCSTDRYLGDKDPKGINPLVPSSTDLCRMGAKLGVRDSFLGNAGRYDVHLTVADNSFAKTARLSGQMRAGFSWVQFYAGGAAETTLNERTYGRSDPTPEPAAERVSGVVGFYPSNMAMFSVDGGLTVSPGMGLSFDVGYYGWVEVLPALGTASNNGFAFPSSTSQIVHTLSSRAVWRF